MDTFITIPDKYKKKNNIMFVKTIIPLFLKEDSRKLGYISLEQCKKIFSTVKLDINNISTIKKHFSLQDLILILLELKRKESKSVQLYDFFQNKTTKMRLPEQFVNLLKERGLLPQNTTNLLTFAEIESVFE